MTVAIKYCGSCNPRYDCAGMAARLRVEFPGLEPVAAQAPDPDFALVICGCGARCADHRNLRGKYGKSVIASAEEFADFCGMLRRILE